MHVWDESIWFSLLSGVAVKSTAVLAVAWLEKCLADSGRWGHRVQVALLGMICCIGLGLIVVMHRSDLIRPLLVWWTGPASPAGTSSRAGSAPTATSTTSQRISLPSASATARTRPWGPA